MKINITINGLLSTRKSTIGQSLALKLNYQFIDSRLFYQYLATKTASQDEQKLLTLLQQEKIEHIFQLNELVFFENDKYIKNSLKASLIAKNNNIQKKINKIIYKNIKEGGYIISGRDSATNILPNAELKFY
ncbi:21339_t:CDS:1 [Racocetra persica]|uniref:21339_t:CDS:1 n=1 Tax=Racocetra persica TaxID=160502 RepID=A0ACA9LAL8_9GLOM|nr:21339_t:CDS:1 [Racocetra persica]